MVLRIVMGPEALSEPARQLGLSVGLHAVRSAASRVLLNELRRYCEGEIHGRSFLIAGHRGAGKTTAVVDAITRVMALSEAGLLPRRPLPVLLHGPSLFSAAAAVGSSSTEGRQEEETKSEKDAQGALTQLILGLHRAAVQEFGYCYRRKVLPLDLHGDDRFSALGAEAGELAAQFELELLEDPPAARLREFWDRAGALADGVLFTQPGLSGNLGERGARDDQGARELVALNGICNAHQRISGELSGESREKQKAEQEKNTGSENSVKLGDLVTPAVSLLSGAVAGGGAAAGGAGISSVVVGVLTTLAAAVTFKSSTTQTLKREREVDRKFIPDLSVRTLDRVLPTLLERLRAAGLAPVFVIDELDKVDDLSSRMKSMVHYLKKLFAENVFTCFLTDRGYFEYLGGAERYKAYGAPHSYFQHSLLMAYTPADLDAYLEDVLVVPAATTPTDGARPASSMAADQADKEVLKWVLRHRSQMHPLNLSRHLVAMRGDAGLCNLAGPAVRGQALFAIDATFQVAIEYVLSSGEVPGWMEQHPRLRQTLLDAAYFVSREWLDGAEIVDLSDVGFAVFREKLTARMNIEECARPPGPTTFPTNAHAPLSVEEGKQLLEVARRIAALLTGVRADDEWIGNWPIDGYRRDGEPEPPRPSQAVREVLLSGDKSLLLLPVAISGAHVYSFRYWPSGRSRLAVEVASSPRAAAARRPEELAATHQTERSYYENMRGTLNEILALGQLPGLPLPEGLRWFADELGVLPKQPPWQLAEQAYGVLQGAEEGRTTLPEVELASRQLTAYVDMLRKHMSTIGPVAACAAFLAGLRPSEQASTAMREALVLLATGLQFHEVNAKSVRANAERFLNWLASMDAGLNSQVPRIGSDGRLRSALKETLLRYYQQGSGFRDYARIRHPEWMRSAWVDVSERVASLSRSGNEPFATAPELVCAALGIGPSSFLRLRLQQTPLFGWSSLLVQCFHRGKGADKDDGLGPHLAAHALLRLCGGRLPDDRAMGLAMVISSSAPGAGALFHGELISAQDLKQEAIPLGTVVLIAEKSVLWPRNWMQPSPLALVLVIDPELIDPRAKNNEFWQALPQPVTFHVVSTAAEPGEQATSAWLSSTKGSHLHERLPVDEVLKRAPTVTGPGGAHDFVSLVRRR